MKKQNVDPAFAAFITALTISIQRLSVEDASDFLTRLETLSEAQIQQESSILTEADASRLRALVEQLRNKVLNG